MIAFLKHLLNFALVAVLYFLVFYKRFRQQGRQNFRIRTAMYVYIALVLHLTIMPFRIAIPNFNDFSFLQTVSLVPFADLRTVGNSAWFGIVLNTLMLLPFGFLLPLCRRCRLVGVTLWTAVFSLSIELTQLLYVWADSSSTRRCDMTDLLTNILGGILGYCLYRLLRKPIAKFLHPSEEMP